MIKSGAIGWFALLFTAQLSAQTWPDFYLTNGTHLTSYGVETYDPATVKNLYVNPTAILKPPGNELGNIYDGNQLILNGGKIVTPVIDEDNFTWNSGKLYLSEGNHSSGYGIDSGSGKALHIWKGAEVSINGITELPLNNHIYLGSIDMGSWGNPHLGGKLRVGNFDASNFHMDYHGTLEVNGTLTGFSSDLTRGWNDIILNGVNARWDTGGMGLITTDDNIGIFVRNGAVLTSAGASVSKDSNEFEISGIGSKWISNGRVWIGGRYGRLTINDGGQVIASGLSLYSNDGTGHTVVVSGSGSRLELSGGLSIDANRIEGFGSSMIVSNGGVVTSSSGMIGGSSAGNWASVEGRESQWNILGDLTLGGTYGGDSLFVSEGGSVFCENAVIGLAVSSRYQAVGDAINVTGSESLFRSTGHITVGAPNNNVCRLTVGNGGRVIAGGGLVVTQDGDEFWDNEINLNNGGNLTVGTDFDASMVGFNFSSGAVLSVEGQLSGLATLESGRRLESPDLLGDLTVHGIFAPGASPADSLLDGNLTVASDGTLEMELGGYALGTEYDRLTVTGLSSLNGLLDIVFLDSFAVTNGATFDLFNWDGGVSGAFSAISTAALSGGQYWDTSELYTTGQLSVVPEPGSIGLLGLGSGILIFARHHRRRRWAGRIGVLPKPLPADTPPVIPWTDLAA